MRPRPSHLITLTIVVCMCSLRAADAAIIHIDALDTGFYSQTGAHVAANENYLTGQFIGSEHRSFFVFDLAGVSDVITGATLTLYNPGGLGPCCNGYASPDATETVTVFDVTTPAATLVGGGAGLVGIFNDLGTGTSFGQRVVSAADNDTTIQITLNAAALAAVNAAIGNTIAFGGALGTLSGAADQYVFGFSTAIFVPADIRRLDLTVVPEPASVALFGVALAALCLRRRRQVRWG